MKFIPRLFGARERIPQNQNHRISAQKHLGDVTILVHRLRLLLAFAGFRDLGPQFLDVLEDHVAMSIKSLHPRQQLLVVSAVDQNLSVVFDALREN